MKPAVDLLIDPDRSLVSDCQEALREGRTPPFRELCERHYARVYRQCLRVLGNECDAHDACQDTFHCLLLRIAGFQHRSRFTSWLHRVTFNCCRELRRSRQHQLNTRSSSGARQAEAASVSASEEDSPAAWLCRRERETQVERAIARLSPPLRSVVVPRYFAHCSYEDIGARLGISVGTVKSRLFRAHDALKDELSRRIDRDAHLAEGVARRGRGRR